MSLDAIKKFQNSVLVQNFKVLYVFPTFKNKNKNAFSVPTPFSSITKHSKLSTIVSIFSSLVFHNSICSPFHRNHSWPFLFIDQMYKSFK